MWPYGFPYLRIFTSYCRKMEGIPFMKNYVYTSLLILSCTAAKGQDYCKLITKEVSEDKKSFTYSSPYNPFDATSVHVTRNINIDPDYPLDNFFIIFRITGNLEDIYTKDAAGNEMEREEKNIIVLFDDNTKMEDTLGVSHDFTDDKLQAIRYVYYPVTDQTVKDFTTKKIVKFSLAGHEQTLQPDSAVAVLHYIQCIKDMGK